MRFFLFFFSIFFCISTASAETLNDLQKAQTTPQGVSLETPLIKPKYLPEFDTRGDKSYEAAQSVIYKIINLILFTAGIIAVLVLILAGFMYTMNAGVESIQTKAKNAIIYSAAGLIAIFVSYTIVENTIRYLYNETIPQQYQEAPTLEQKNVVEIQKTQTVPSTQTGK